LREKAKGKGKRIPIVLQKRGDIEDLTHRWGKKRRGTALTVPWLEGEGKKKGGSALTLLWEEKRGARFCPRMEEKRKPK